ncbi:MAG: tRNA-guanine transglycosylase DpdA [Candidatus Kariarchaeaceae archaeon]|jgi:hypothetical protein
MKFYIPNWEDRLDPNFDFVKDSFSSSRVSPRDDLYAHNIFKSPPYDGILMSLNIFGNKIILNGTAEIKGYEDKSIKEYLKINNQKLTVGAFSYINEEHPPENYSIEYICDIYEKLRFDLGVSVDHLMNKNLSIEENELRRKLSIANANNFFEYWKKNNFQFKPIGSAQGYNIESYKDSLLKLIDIGYEYIGLGSLIPKSDEFIIDLLKDLNSIVNSSNTKVHLFGILRRNIISEYKRFGVSSFDSASYLRKAWLRSDNNYLGIDEKWYAAIRVPIIEGKSTERKLVENGHNIEKLKKDEQAIFRLLNEYDTGNDGVLEELLHKVIHYDRILVRSFENMSKYEPRYREVLESKIWKKCDCEMCKAAGIHIIVFRRTNRNKRRGFHNTLVFYNKYVSNTM